MEHAQLLEGRKLQCDYRIDDRCLLAESIARDHGCTVKILVTESACRECVNTYKPKNTNNVTISLAVKKCSDKGQLTASLMTENKAIMEEYAKMLPLHTIKRFPSGPGTVLHNLLAALGFEPSKDCSCWQYIHIMNVRGVEWCELNLETIVDWIGRGSRLSKIPLVRTGLKCLVNHAISEARKGTK
ncbi:MAG: hypothetical protein KatS3mg087_1116 [Patescibacteria group bacterium]|nr:MAG: hypothetical protein KatS3mg087_1116 [Patescibacteria group bacterium]